MKRRASSPLFRDIEPVVYLFDTSAWLDIEAHIKCEAIWDAIRRLADDGRAVTCAQVVAEIRDDPIYEARIKPLEKVLLTGDGNGSDPVYLQHVGKITHDFPGMCKARGWKTPADPYVVALAQMENYTVVADENMRRKNRKIPGVCLQLRIRCLTLAKFIIAEVKK
jgi:hypothetical protein